MPVVTQADRVAAANPEQNTTNPFIIYLPGFTGGGRNITMIRDDLTNRFGDNVYIPSSASAPEAYHAGETLDVYYDRLALHIEASANSRDLTIFAHSSGGFEAIKLMETLLQRDNWQGKNMHLHSISPIGFDSNGLSNIIDAVKRAKALDDFAYYEQHIAYPLPDAYYSLTQRLTVPKSQIIFEDTDKQREDRRNRFREWMQYIRSPQEAAWILQDVARIDKVIMERVHYREGSEGINTLLMERAKRLEKSIHTLFRGRQVCEETHQEYLAKYHEKPEELTDPLWYSAMLGLYMAQGTKYLFDGMSASLASVVKQGETKGVSIQYDFVLQERNQISTPAKAREIMEGLTHQQIEGLLAAFWFVENGTHSGLGYDEGLLMAITSLR